MRVDGGGSEELQAALERERLLGRISRKVRSELDLDKVLQVAVDETGRSLGVSGCFIRLGDSEEALPVVAEWSAPGHPPIAGQWERLSVSTLAARERRAVAVPDVVSASELDDPSLGGRQSLLSSGTRSALATPILVFGRMIGVFALHRAETGNWTGGEISLAETVAGEVGLAIHIARLLRENDRRLEEQAALLGAAQAVTTDLRFESVLQRLVAEVTQLLRVEAADCYLYEADRRVLRCAAVFGLPRELVGTRVRDGRGLAGRAIAAGAAAVANEHGDLESSFPDPAYAGFRSAVAVPITWQGDTRGVLGVATRDPDRRFDRGDVELLDAFARFAALALANAESFEEHERNAQVQRAFYRIADMLAAPLSLPETLWALARAACEAVGAPSAVVLAATGGGFEIEASHGVSSERRAEVENALAAPGPALVAAVAEGRIVSARAVEADERLDETLRATLGRAGYAALVSAPVEARDGSKAVVVLFREPRALTDQDLALLRHVADAGSGALERSELFEAERRAHQLSERLAAIGARLVTNLDPVSVLEDLATEARALVAADAAVVRLLADDELVVAAASGAGAADLVGSRSGSAFGVLADVLRSRAPAVVEHAGSTAAWGDPLLGVRMAASVAVPMVAHGGGVRGALSVYARGPRSWRDEELQALVALTGASSAALSNAELYQRVAEEKERSEAILANIADGIVAVDREERIVLWNAAAEEITGVPTEEALGRRVQDVLQRDLSAAPDRPRGEREVVIGRGGMDAWLSLTEAVMHDPAGAVAGRIFAFRDVSQERAVEEMKSDFVSAVSHELRTPLTSIYGFAETLLRGDVSFGDEERKTFLRYIASESERLIAIVDDLLNVARLESGTLELSLVHVDVGEVVREVAERVQEQEGDRRRFLLELPEEPAFAEADRDKLAQVVFNLLDNAVKFSPGGEAISVSVRRRRETVEVRVTDEGVGISSTDQQRLFTKFYRAETAPAGVRGAGLGLFLVRGLIAAMNGKVSVESKPGQGSSFAFELPASKWPRVVTEPVEAAARA